MKKALVRFLIATLIISAMSLPASAKVERFDALIDSYTTSRQPEKNYGSIPHMYAFNDFSSPGMHSERSFINFNLTTIPKNARIKSASLFVNGHTGSNDGSPPINQRIGAATIEGPGWWDENTITYNNYHQEASLLLPDRVFTPQASYNQFWSQSFVSVVQGWVNGSQPNYGVFLSDMDSSDQYWTEFFAREMAPIFLI